jgi:hypothetical protein
MKLRIVSSYTRSGFLDHRSIEITLGFRERSRSEALSALIINLLYTGAYYIRCIRDAIFTWTRTAVTFLRETLIFGERGRTPRVLKR